MGYKKNEFCIKIISQKHTQIMTTLIDSLSEFLGRNVLPRVQEFLGRCLYDACMEPTWFHLTECNHLCGACRRIDVNPLYEGIPCRVTRSRVLGTGINISVVSVFASGFACSMFCKDKLDAICDSEGGKTWYEKYENEVANNERFERTLARNHI